MVKMAAVSQVKCRRIMLVWTWNALRRLREIQAVPGPMVVHMWPSSEHWT